jgi:hypothetical protein
VNAARYAAALAADAAAGERAVLTEARKLLASLPRMHQQ